MELVHHWSVVLKIKETPKTQPQSLIRFHRSVLKKSSEKSFFHTTHEHSKNKFNDMSKFLQLRASIICTDHHHHHHSHNHTQAFKGTKLVSH